MTTDPMTTDAVVKSACSYCGVGCGMVLQVATDADGRRRVTKASGDKTHPTNFGRLCTKGSTTADMLAAVRKTGLTIIDAPLGGEYSIDGLRIEVLGVRNPEITVNAMNNSSMVLRVSDGTKSVLFLGDLGVEQNLK